MMGMEPLGLSEFDSLTRKELTAMIARQAAHIEMMREALKWIQNRCAGEAMPNWENTPHTGHSRGLILDRTNYALSTTTDQALEQFAAKVREQCAQVCESMSGSDYSPKQCASAIRAIKDLP